ncbi:MAG TPA: hypothetical protein VH280_08755 [Verrucomicrobiae bacterium]|jgi:hypothetical protein|nr:hypothetical protein [Verrucomicrobiae bacterium]
MKLKILLICAAISLMAASFVSAQIPSADALLPADTLLVFSVPDCSAMRGTMQQSPQWLLWNDPSMKSFRNDFTAKWNQKFVRPFEQSLGIRIADYLPLLQGQLTFAITGNGWGKSRTAAPAMVLLLDAGSKGNLLATNLAALKDHWTASGKGLRTETLEDVKFSVLLLSSNSPMPFSTVLPTGGNTGTAPAIYIGQYKSLLIMGTSEGVVGNVAAHLHGGANPSLGQNAQFAADKLAQFYQAPLYYGWFDAKTFLDGLSKLPFARASSLPVTMGDIMTASGLGGLKSVSLTYRESRDGAQVELYADAPESGRQGLLKMVTAAPKDANPPPFVPAGAAKFMRWRIDGQKSWGELQKTLEAISPSALDRLNAFIAIANATGQQQDPDFDIRKDLLSNLGDDWISYSMAPNGKTLADMNAAPWLFLFSAQKADQAALAIKTVASMASAASGSSGPQTQVYLGRKIYTISLPGAAGASGRAFYCTSSGGYVALTTDISMIQNYLRSNDGKTKPLSQRPGLVEAAQEVGGMGNGLFGYQNQRESARVLFSVLKNDPALGAALNPLSAMPFTSAGQGIRDLMDFSLLPDYDAVSKYFNFTVYAGNATSQGLDFKIFQPRSPELN